MRWWLALALMILPGLAAAQQDDRGYLTAYLEDNLSGAGRVVTITGFEGALSSRATMTELTIADDQGVWITLRDVVLDWNRSALLQGRLSVNALTAGEIVLERPPVADSTLPSPEARGFALPELPVSVEIGRIAAERIVLGEAVLGSPVEGRLEASAALVAGEGAGRLLLERTDEGPEGQVSLSAAYANATRALSLDLSATEAAGGIAASVLNIPGRPSLDLRIAGEGLLEDFTADVRIASEGQDRLAGTVALLAEEGGAQGFRADLAGDLAPLFLPDYAAFLGPEVSLTTSGRRAATGRLDLDDFRLTTRALSVEGTLVLAPDGLPERIALSGVLADPDGTPVLLPLPGDAETRVGRADVTLGFDAADHDGWTLDAVLTGLDRADFAAERVQLAGSGRITRGPQGNVAGGTLRFQADGLAPADPALAAALGDSITGEAKFFRREGDSLRLPSLALSGADYGVEAGGLIGGIAQGLPMSGTARVRADDLTRFAALTGRPLAGGLTGEVSGGGTLLAGSFDIGATLEGRDLETGIAEADNLLRGPSRIGLSVKRDETGTLLRRLDIAAQSLTAVAEGRIATAGSDVTASLDFTDLSVLGGDWRGSLAGTARITGTAEDAVLLLDATGQGLGTGQPQADALLKGQSRLSVEAGFRDGVTDLRQLRVVADALTAGINGTIAPGGNDLRAEVAVSDLAALGEGWRGAVTAKAAFTGTVSEGRLTTEGAGQDIGAGIPEADRLLAGRTVFSAAAALEGGLLRIESAALRNPQGEANLSGSADDLTLQARLANLGLLVPQFPGPVTVSGTAKAEGSDYLLNLTGTGPGRIAARLSGLVAGNGRRADLRLSGSAQAGLANIFLRPRTISGPVSFDLAISGPLALRSVSGRMSLGEGRLSDPDLPFSLTGITARADLSGGTARVSFSTGLTSGGRIEGSGSVALSEPFDADLTAQLQRVTVRDPRLYETRMSGRVALDGPLTGGAAISGRITLGDTELRVPSTGFGASGLLPGLQHVNEPADVRKTRDRAGLTGQGAVDGWGGGARPFALDLVVSAPSRIFVRGRGLDAELGGELRLTGTTADILPSGGFELIRGRLDILGKRLVLSEASLQLAGSFDPLIDVAASTESDGITASVRISGRASEPQVSFTSAPELPEEEVLARLLFGRALTELSALQAVQLAGAVATLAGRGGEGIIGRLRQGFGLDDLDFQTSEDGGTEVTFGKYISSNVYSEIVVGDEGQSEIHLNLDVTDSLTVKGRVSDDGTSGLGLFFEKDY